MLLTACEHLSQSLRCALPVPLWLAYFCGNAPGAGGPLAASLLCGLYLAQKAYAVRGPLCHLWRAAAAAAAAGPAGLPEGEAAERGPEGTRPATEAEVASAGCACAVCTEAIGAEDAVALPACGHAFCGGCLVKWADRQAEEGRPVTCPLCRAEQPKVTGAVSRGAREAMLLAYGDGGTSMVPQLF